MYKVSWWLAIAAFLFCVFLMLDYHLPTLHFDEPAKYGTQERGPRKKYQEGDLISLMATEHFLFVVPHKVHLDYDYHADDKEILHIEVTRLLKIPRNVSLNLNDQHFSFEVEDTICTRGLALIVYVVVILAVTMILVRGMNRMISEMISVPVNLMTISILLGYFIFGGH